MGPMLKEQKALDYIAATTSKHPDKGKVKYPGSSDNHNSNSSSFQASHFYMYFFKSYPIMHLVM